MTIPDPLTIRELLDIARKITTPEDGAALVAVLVARACRDTPSLTEETAAQMVRSNLGYVSGYCDVETRRRFEVVFGAMHPDYERSLLRERVVAGVRRAQACGKHCGRPRKELDLRPALALLNEGRGLKDVARILKVPRATLRRRLDEAGRWPVGRQAA